MWQRAGRLKGGFYAKFMIEAVRRQSQSLREAGSARFPSTSAPNLCARPRNSRLDTTKLKSTFDLCLPYRNLGVERMLI